MSSFRIRAVALMSGTMLSSLATAQDLGTVDVRIHHATSHTPRVAQRKVSAVPAKPAPAAPSAPSQTASVGASQTTKPVLASPGQVTEQNTPQANTTIGRQALDALPASSNYMQDLQYLPGVNVSSKDPTGIFGGAFSIRGLDNTQINLTVDGISQNDPGTGALLPQIALDNENICSIKVQESGYDVREAPAPLGSVGGNVAIRTCAPADKFGIMYNQSVGSFSSHREFVRLDTGGMLDNHLKGFVSFSNTGTDIFYGYGNAKRQHIDSRWELETSPNNLLTIQGFWTLQNKLAQRQITLAQYQAYGYEGFGNTFNSPVIGTKDEIAAAAASPSALTTTANQLYANSFNDPGIWWGASIKDEWKPTSDVTVTVQPYTWFQFSGTNSSYGAYDLTNGFGTAVLNGQTVTIGQVNNSNQFALVSTQGNSQILRTGVNSYVDWKIGPQTVTAGVTFENVDQSQHTPFQQINADGTLSSTWFSSGSLLKQANGQEATQRAWGTHTTIVTPTISDEIKLLDGRLSIDPALRFPITNRTFTNYPADSLASYEYYQVSRQWEGVTPQIGVSYDINARNQVFTSVSRGYEVPTNSIDGNVVNPTTGAILYTPPTKAETSTDYEAGYRYHDNKYNFQATAYHINFYNRIALLPATSGGFSSTGWINVGGTTTNGAEVSGAVKAGDNLTLFATADYNDSRMNNDIMATDGVTTFLTKDKTYYNSPLWQGAIGATYQIGAATVTVTSKYTGKVYATLVDDQSISGYNLVNVGIAYDLKKDHFFDAMTQLVKGEVVSLNVENLFNTRYLQLPSSGNSGPQTTAGGNPTYLPGTPLYISGQIAFKF